jgi:hypothetical protein
LAKEIQPSFCKLGQSLERRYNPFSAFEIQPEQFLPLGWELVKGMGAKRGKRETTLFMAAKTGA